MNMSDLLTVLSPTILIVGGIALLLIDLAIPRSNKVFTAYLSIVTMLGALTCCPRVLGRAGERLQWHGCSRQFCALF